MTELIRATQVRIHLDSLRSNAAAVREAIPGTATICAAVKANGYGHGAVQVSRALRQANIEVLGVSSPFEGLELREAGDRGRILVLGPTVPGEVDLTVSAGLETMVTDSAFLGILESALKKSSAPPLSVHLKIDTGMGRVGCRPEEALGLAERIAENPRLVLAGTATHFPSADSSAAEDNLFTAEQAGVLSEIARQLKNAGIDPGILHAANSGGVSLGSGFSFDMVRPGIALYGYGKPIHPGFRLKPVMELTTRITAIKKIHAGESVSYGRTWKARRDTFIATLPVGYADGYPRSLSNRAEVLIGRRRHKVAGTVCMDQLMVDLGERTDVSLYDEAVLFGPDPAGPDAAELAEQLGTIPYEITCGISPRVPRVYLPSPAGGH